MMKDIKIKLNKETRMVDLSNSVIGNDSENLQGNIIFSFTDEFVNGQARLEYKTRESVNWLALNKIDNTYQTPIKSVVTQKGQILMQLVITEETTNEGIPIFKSNVFYVYCNSSINAVDKAPEEYDSWIDIANTKLNEIDNLDVDINNGVLTITKKDGSTKSEYVKGEQGIKGDKGEPGESGVYLGTDEPTDPTINVWVDSDGEPDEDLAVTNKNNNFSSSQTINGTLTINGDIVQNGSTYETHAEQIYTKNNIIKTREGAIGGLSSNEITGIEAEKYDGDNNGILGFKADGTAYVGDIGDEQPLLTRDEVDNLSNGKPLVWDSTNLKAVSSNDYVQFTDVATQTAFGTAKMWTSTNEDGEIGLNISTEV